MLGSRYAKGWYRKAQALQQLGRITEAGEAAQKAAHLDPKNAQSIALLKEIHGHAARERLSAAQEADGQLHAQTLGA